MNPKKEIIKKVFENTDNEFMLRNDIIQQIEQCMEMYANQPDPKWISVNDQMPTKKAKELVEKYLDYVEWNINDHGPDIENARQCAIILADEMLSQLSKQKTLESEVSFQYWRYVKFEVSLIK